MGSLLRRVKERKKTRRLGEVEVMEQEGYGELEVDSKVEMIRALVPLGLMHVHELLDAEVSELAGERYVRKSETSEQSLWRKRLQRAYGRPTHKEALEALEQLHRELEERNQSAASSLEEGLEETLTLHRLGVYGVLGHSLKTTNCIESVNALIEERCAKVDHWKTSNQRQRWLATALTDIEPRLRKVMGYRHLPKLREALKRELKIETAKKNTSRKNVA